MNKAQSEPLPPGAKSPQTAFLLDFLFPGVGHLYGSGGQKGMGLLIANIVVGITVPFVYVTFLLNIVLWGIAIMTAADVAREYNQKLADATKEANAKQLAAIEQVQNRQAAERAQIRGSQLAEEVRKLSTLRKMNVVSDAEFAAKKGELIEGLVSRHTTEPMGDFFLPLGPLLESGDLVENDVARLKTIHQAIYSTTR